MDWEKLLTLIVAVMTIIDCTMDCPFIYTVILGLLASVLGVSVVYRIFKMKKGGKNNG